MWRLCRWQWPTHDNTPLMLHSHWPGCAMGSCCGGSGVWSLLPTPSEVADASLALAFCGPPHPQLLSLPYTIAWLLRPFHIVLPTHFVSHVPPLSPRMPCPRSPRSPLCPRTPLPLPPLPSLRLVSCPSSAPIPAGGPLHPLPSHSSPPGSPHHTVFYFACPECRAPISLLIRSLE